MLGHEIMVVPVFMQAVAKVCCLKKINTNSQQGGNATNGSSNSSFKIMLKKSVLKELILDPDFNSNYLWYSLNQTKTDFKNNTSKCQNEMVH